MQNWPDRAVLIVEPRILWAIKKWRHLLEPKLFTIVTNHSALQWVLNSTKNTSCLIRWLLIPKSSKIWLCGWVQEGKTCILSHSSHTWLPCVYRSKRTRISHLHGRSLGRATQRLRYHQDIPDPSRKRLHSTWTVWGNGGQIISSLSFERWAKTLQDVYTCNSYTNSPSTVPCTSIKWALRHLQNIPEGASSCLLTCNVDICKNVCEKVWNVKL